MKQLYKLEYVARQICSVYIRANGELYKSVGLSQTGPIIDMLPLARAADAIWWEAREGG